MIQILEGIKGRVSIFELGDGTQVESQQSNGYSEVTVIHQAPDAEQQSEWTHKLVWPEDVAALHYALLIDSTAEANESAEVKMFDIITDIMEV